MKVSENNVGSHCLPSCCFSASSACELSMWNSWSSCTASCNGGVQTRSRHVVKLPDANEIPCEGQMESRRCSNQPCPVGTFVLYSFHVAKLPVEWCLFVPLQIV